jgi:GNAT superfamily N-acetyltransferase
VTILDEALRSTLGTWPPVSGMVTIASSPTRLTPGWDGRVRPFSGVRTPEGTIVSVPADLVEDARRLITDESSLTSGLRELGLVRREVTPWTMRWVTDDRGVADLEPLGEWVAPDHPSMPEWVAPFPGQVLAALDADGAYLGVVAIKPVATSTVEIAVGTAERSRGLGIARRLVVTAVRAQLDKGLAVLYVHAVDNRASARVAEAVGLIDRRWQLLAPDDAEPS